ncbi:MAG TPA: c-type cytochrome domain-containing protein [Planctomycetota bacterium]|nr:c-type cytochrome domain-containing protein [Planctomycetota bacterium]
MIFRSAIVFCFLGATARAADGDVSYTRDIVPILKHNCQACHYPGKLKGNLDVTTYASLQKGGKHGPAFKAGDAKSKILEDIKGTDPKMPEDGDPLPGADIAKIEKWIVNGAKDDTPTGAAKVEIAVYKAAPVVTAMAFSPDGATLAIAGHHEILLHKGDGSSLIARLPCEAPRIESLCYSKDGKLLAACGGAPAQFGWVQIWNAADNKTIASYHVTGDSLYGVSISPDNEKVAFGCADKTARMISIKDGAELLKFDNHADWVLGTFFTLDGKRLLTGSRDRAMKLVDLVHGQLIDDINKLLDPIACFARHPKQDVVAYGSTTGAARIYKISDNQGRTAANNDTNLVKELERQPGPVRAICYSPDGEAIALGGTGPEVRVYKADGSRVATLTGHNGPVFSIAFDPSGKAIATAGMEGEVRLFEFPSGKLIKAFVPVPVVARK